VQFSEAAMSLTLNYSEVVQTVRRPRRNEEKAQVAEDFFLIMKNQEIGTCQLFNHVTFFASTEQWY